MASTKVTFSLDDETLQRLNNTAEQLNKPKSQVVREAIEDYAERAGRLSEAERRRLLQAFDELVPAIPERPVGDVEHELAEIRVSRHQGGRASSTQ
jgi:predicted DNA-binding protein